MEYRCGHEKSDTCSSASVLITKKREFLSKCPLFRLSSERLSSEQPSYHLENKHHSDDFSLSPEERATFVWPPKTLWGRGITRILKGLPIFPGNERYSFWRYIWIQLYKDQTPSFPLMNFQSRSMPRAIQITNIAPVWWHEFLEEIQLDVSFIT